MKMFGIINFIKLWKFFRWKLGLGSFQSWSQLDAFFDHQGALTHGDRRATGERDLSRFNIDNKYGRAGQISCLVLFDPPFQVLSKTDHLTSVAKSVSRQCSKLRYGQQPLKDQFEYDYSEPICLFNSSMIFNQALK